MAKPYKMPFVLVIRYKAELPVDVPVQIREIAFKIQDAQSRIAAIFW